jgi:hypothetical protein
MTTRTAALCYLPTVGLWSAVRAVRYYLTNPRG